MTLSESELFTGDTSNDNHFPGPVIREVNPSPFKRSKLWAADGKFVCFFSYIIKCQSINYDSVKFQVKRLQNEKVTIHLFASSNKQEGATLLILFNLDGSDEIGYFTWKFQLHALMM